MDEKLAGLTSMIAELYPRNPQKQPLNTNPAPSALLGSEQHVFKPPDLQGFGEMGQALTQSFSPTQIDQRQEKIIGTFSLFSKIGFPSFDGTHLRDWLYKSEQFFMVENTTPGSKVQLASIHFEGKALKWHLNYMSERYGVFPGWNDYLMDLSMRFGDAYDDPLSELVSLKQAGDSVEDFLDKFECALTRLKLPDSHDLSIFLTNLNPSLALHTRQFHVANVVEAARIAKLHEAYINHNNSVRPKAPFTPNTPKPPYQNAYKSPNTPAILPTPRTFDNQRTTSLKQPHFPKHQPDKYPRKYSFDEMQERK